MEVNLIEYTGIGSPDAGRHAAELLVFTKNTRLEMVPKTFYRISLMSDEDLYKELSYMANTIPSSWEFVDYVFLITDVSRAFTHQFVRTRTASFAQQTMRVLNKHGWTYEIGPSIEENTDEYQMYCDTMETISAAYDDLIDLGVSIEDARGVLPTNIHTNIVAKFNLRVLADTVRKRASSRTQGEYRSVLDAIVAEVMRVHPWAHLFFNRSFDAAAKDLEAKIMSFDNIARENRIEMVKLIDVMRMTA